MVWMKLNKTYMCPCKPNVGMSSHKVDKFAIVCLSLESICHCKLFLHIHDLFLHVWNIFCDKENITTFKCQPC